MKKSLFSNVKFINFYEKMQNFINNSYRELSNDAQIILHTIINLLLRLLRAARAYADIGVHGTTKLTSYFSLLGYCMVSKTEKVMVGILFVIEKKINLNRN